MDSASGSKSVDSGSKSPDDDSDSSLIESSSAKKTKKFSPTLDTIKSFKNAVYQIFHICAKLSYNSNVDVDQLRRLSDTLKIAIEILKESKQEVQKRLEKLKELMDELPTEETSPYKKSSICTSDGTDFDAVAANFIRAYTNIVFLATDVIHSIEPRSTLKLLAIQRTYESQMNLLEKAKALVNDRQTSANN